MVRAPVLALPNATDPFILDTDASDKSVGAELIQIQEGEAGGIMIVFGGKGEGKVHPSRHTLVSPRVIFGNLSTSFLFLGLGQFFISLIYPGPMYIPLGPTTLSRNSTSF
jgi:hypothetical protein